MDLCSLLPELPGRPVVQLRRQHGGVAAGRGGHHPGGLHPVLSETEQHPLLVSQQLHERWVLLRTGQDRVGGEPLAELGRRLVQSPGPGVGGRGLKEEAVSAAAET